MEKIIVASNSNIRVQNEGNNLINKNQIENIDYSNINNDKTKNMTNLCIIDRNFGSVINIKEKNIASSKELKSEMKKIKNNNRKMSKTIQKSNSLSSSFTYYKENKCILKIKKIYSSKQRYISIILLIYSFILFILSFYDLYKKINNKKGTYLLCNIIIFICELICSGIIILFHVIYFFINISYNNIIFLIMSIIIMIFCFIYANTYVKQNVNLIEIILYVVLNLLLIIMNLIYLFVSYKAAKHNNKVQQNIEDIMNISLRNEKIQNFEKERNKDSKNKPVVLVEEENQNNNI